VHTILFQVNNQVILVITISVCIILR